MILTATKTETFIDHGYIIDIVSLRNDYEAWISCEDYGIKHLMFGMPKEQQSYKEFCDIVEANINDYKDLCDEEGE